MATSHWLVSATASVLPPSSQSKSKSMANTTNTPNLPVRCSQVVHDALSQQHFPSRSALKASSGKLRHLFQCINCSVTAGTPVEFLSSHLPSSGPAAAAVQRSGSPIRSIGKRWQSRSQGNKINLPVRTRHLSRT